MPTGYTDKIKDGIPFNDFIMQCARGMRACVTMCEEPMNKEIPEKFEPSDYHKKEIMKAKYELSQHQKIDESAAALLARQEYDEQVKRYKNCIEESYQLKEQYNKMLAVVKEWQPPTPEHDGLKRFMIQQLKVSIDFDCGTSYYDKPKLLSGRDWLSLKISTALHDIDYHTKEDGKERERAASRTTWIRQLRGSLNDIE